MKSIRRILVLITFGLMTFGAVKVKAQCAACAAQVASNNASGANTTKGLNHGIVYLLAAPYLAVAAMGLIWYKKYRRKNVSLDVPRDKLNLN
ncbi:MAG: hypothetical protein JSU01_15870 [Bacteroidetes bacterium]|nr:hypothetical protein [Bacteroidota bacterium]